jgi:hypothetical protein
MLQVLVVCFCSILDGDVRRRETGEAASVATKSPSYYHKLQTDHLSIKEAVW